MTFILPGLKNHGIHLYFTKKSLPNLERLFYTTRMKGNRI
jgi:hypothetical protein